MNLVFFLTQKGSVGKDRQYRKYSAKLPVLSPQSLFILFIKTSMYGKIVMVLCCYVFYTGGKDFFWKLLCFYGLSKMGKKLVKTLI